MQATWFGKATPKSPFSKHPIRRQSVFRRWRCSLAVGKNSKQVGLLEILLKPNGHWLSGIMPAPEQSCSHASSHGRLRFSYRPVIGTTANAQSSLSSPFSVGMKLLFTPWTVLVMGNNRCTPGICKTTKVSSIRHLFGLGGGGGGGSPPILSLFGFSEMSDNWRPPLRQAWTNHTFFSSPVPFFGLSILSRCYLA